MKVWMYVLVTLILVAGVGFGAYTYGVQQGQAQTQNIVASFQTQRGAGGASGNGAGSASALGPCGPVQAFGGRQGGQGATGAQDSGQGGTTLRGGQGGNNFSQFGTCVARGQVTAVENGQVKVSTPVNVVTVNVGDKTLISKTDQGTIADIKVGDTVTVFSPDTGDSPSASFVQIQREVGQAGAGGQTAPRSRGTPAAQATPGK